MGREQYEIKIAPVDAPVNASVRPPGSKSLTNRALLCAALASGKSKLTGALDSDDTRVMIQCLKDLGIELHSANGGTTVEVSGCGGQIPNCNAKLFVGNSGTTIRFLTAALGFAGGEFELDGVARMRERPIADLADALGQLGANVETLSPGGCPPVKIDSGRIESGTATVNGNLSSQYLSGLMMGAPIANGEIVIDLEGELVSRPYVEMTRSVMKSFGVNCEIDDSFRRVKIGAGQDYRGTDFEIEPDASAASYFWAIAAICGGTVTVEGLNRDSIQGDVAFVDCLSDMGCQIQTSETGISVTGPATQGIDVDMSAISDTAQTLSTVALFVPGTTIIRGIAHNRIKETDRIENLAKELRKLGATVETFEDGLSITAKKLKPATLETYDDHRMAMSLALAGLKIPGVKILDPNCVSKTYPWFFSDLAKISK